MNQLSHPNMLEDLQTAPQTEWKPLLICPGDELRGEVLSTVGEWLSLMECPGDHGYPPLKSVLGTIAKHGRNICFLDVGTNEDAAIGILTALAENSIPVIAVHISNDSDLILRSLRCGASEFLFHPLNAAQLRAALDRLGRKLESPGTKRNMGKVFGFMPAKGNYGSTTIACNLAMQIRKFLARKVLLADLDPLTGSISFLLKLKSPFSFVDAIADWDRMDEDLWKRLVTPYHGIDVLLAPEIPIADNFPLQSLPAVLRFWRELYGAVIFDSPGPLSEWQLGLSKLCDSLMLITTNELAAIHDTRRTLSYLERSGVDRSRIGLIVNRYKEDNGLSRQAIETALKVEVFHVLPNDYEGVQKAVLDGKMVQPGSKFGRAIIELCERLTGVEPAPSKKKWSSYFGISARGRTRADSIQTKPA